MWWVCNDNERGGTKNMQMHRHRFWDIAVLQHTHIAILVVVQHCSTQYFHWECQNVTTIGKVLPCVLLCGLYIFLLTNTFSTGLWLSTLTGATFPFPTNLTGLLQGQWIQVAPHVSSTLICKLNEQYNRKRCMTITGLFVAQIETQMWKTYGWRKDVSWYLASLHSYTYEICSSYPTLGTLCSSIISEWVQPCTVQLRLCCMEVTRISTYDICAVLQ